MRLSIDVPPESFITFLLTALPGFY